MDLEDGDGAAAEAARPPAFPDPVPHFLMARGAATGKASKASALEPESEEAAASLAELMGLELARLSKLAASIP